MRIALLTNFFPPEEQHGIARYVEDLAVGLAERHHEVVVIALSPNLRATEKRKNFTIYWVPKFKRWWTDFLPSLALLINSIKIRKVLYKINLEKPFDVVEYPNDGCSAFAVLIKGISFPSPKFVNRLSSPRKVFNKQSKLPRLTETLEALQARFSDAIIGNTYANLRLCEKIYGIKQHIPRTVILHGLPCKAYSVNKLPSSHGEKLNILFLGRMEARKGFDLLAKAWPKILASIPSATLVVAGEDTVFNKNYSYFKWALKDIPSNARNSLKYLGTVSSEVKELLYEQCDLCVMPSRYESFGLVLLEAMRYAKPVVSCQVGGIPEVVTHGKTGWLVSPDNVDALAEAIIQLLKTPALRQQLGITAYHHAKEFFTLERVAAQTEKFYLELLGQKIEGKS